MRVNGVEMPLAEMSGILAVETPDGHQSWALVVDAQIEYKPEVTVSYGDSPQFTLIARMKPGEMMRQAHTIEPGEENVLVYSRLLVAVLREERERYADLENLRNAERVGKLNAEHALEVAVREHAEELHRAWREGARSGYGCAMAEQNLTDLLDRNPHPMPEDDETDGCHVCGGPDH